MADLTITGTVLPVTPTVPGSASTPRFFLAGEDLDQGMPIYLDTGTNTYKKALSSGTAAQAGAVAITVGEAKAGQLVPAMQGAGGQITLGTTAGLQVGMQYVVSANAGKIMPYSDLAPTDYVSYLFYWDGISADLNIAPLGLQWPTTTTTTTTTTT